MAGKRRHKRIIKRLDVRFSSEGSNFRGTSSNFSEGGLFIRTMKPLPPDTQVEVSIKLPDDTVSKLKGTVRCSLKSLQRAGRSGMGIEISENDRHYVNFLNTLLPPGEQILYREHEKAAPAPPGARIGHAAPQESGPVISPKSLSSAGRRVPRETEEEEIDSLISSLFSKSEKKND